MAVMDYRTRDGLADYGFSIEFQPDTGWRVYIIFQPFPQHHDDSLQLPKQAIEGNRRRYVDWSGKLNSPGDAKAVAALWAEMAERYQRTQEQRRATSADPDRLGAGGAGPGHQDCGPAIPYPRTAAVPLSDRQKSEPPDREVA